ncbi:MAG: hypothetical protein JST32_10880 [Bacteroidetes bacterium]|nr:hypothetical protein [Bacteroidota bacterium]
MKQRIFKPALLIAVLLAFAGHDYAQDSTAAVQSPDKDVKASKCLKLGNINIDMHDLNLAMNDVNAGLKEGFSELNANLRSLGPALKDLSNNINISFNDDDLEARVQKGEIGEKIKNYTKSYPMDANDRLSIENKYGKVVVNTWVKNEVKVDVQIKSYSNDDDDAQKMLDAINISDSKNGDVVSFRTSFGNGGSSIWNLFNHMNDHHRVEVNYTIYMPSKSGLDISNHYGSTEIPDFDGKVNVDGAYGSLSAGTLTHPGTRISVRYGSASIEGLSAADVDMSYGSLNLGSVDKINGDFRYGSMKIGKIRNSANIDAHYAGTLQVDELDKNFSNLSVNCSYSTVKIGVNNAANADFDITVRYGGFDFGDVPVEITQKTPPDDSKGWKPTKNYKGHIGKGSSDRTINISTNYGSVKFE